jgi:hypothetical protein
MVKPSARKGKEGGGGLGMMGGVIPMLLSKKKDGGKATRKGRDLGGPATGIAGRGQKEGVDYMPLSEMLEIEKMKMDSNEPGYNKGQGPTAAAVDRLRNMKRFERRDDISPVEALKKRNAGGRTARKEGGGVFSGPGYPGKVPGVTGGRIARATGGKTKGKGKTNINIVIAAGQKQPGADMMGPPPGMGQPPGGLPIPVPPGAGAGGPPMPMPMPVAAPAPMPAPMPTPRKSGGRLTKVAHSYKDMEAGAGSGEGRLQKTDIAKFKAGRKEGGKVGHRTYRSYKDMDAGSGSGFGRLEKAEIQKHKH